MSETWHDQERWEGIKRRAPQEFRWKVQLGMRNKKKGRCMRGMVMGIRRDLCEVNWGRMEPGE